MTKTKLATKNNYTPRLSESLFENKEENIRNLRKENKREEINCLPFCLDGMKTREMKIDRKLYFENKMKGKDNVKKKITLMIFILA